MLLVSVNKSHARLNQPSIIFEGSLVVYFLPEDCLFDSHVAARMYRHLRRLVAMHPFTSHVECLHDSMTALALKVHVHKQMQRDMHSRPALPIFSWWIRKMSGK